jgi:hypothetical protein
MSTISGKWKGTYIYVSEDGTEGKSKSFDMILREEEDDEFTGEIVDTSENSQNTEVAKVNGFIMEDTLSFVKQYPYLFFYNEKGELQIDKSKPHPEIHYHGEIKENEIAGEWDMEIGTKQFYRDYYSKMMSGRWQVKKVVE